MGFKIDPQKFDLKAYDRLLSKKLKLESDRELARKYILQADGTAVMAWDLPKLMTISSKILAVDKQIHQYLIRCSK